MGPAALVVLFALTARGTDALDAAFSPFDRDGDGRSEIERVTTLSTVGGIDAPLVLVLVEERLLRELVTAGDGGDRALGSLRPTLERLARDLVREGFSARLLAVRVARGDGRRDGAKLLALRELLRFVDREAPGGLAGALLVGRFPHAYLVRTVNWRKREPLVLRRGRPDERRYEEPVDFLRTVPEDVAHTCDLVLADLDGAWERLYVERRLRLPSLVAVFPGGVPAEGGVCEDFERGGVVFQDFFLVNDGRVETAEVLDGEGAVRGLWVRPRDDDRDDECAPADRARPNPIARPDVAVSRIDAFGVARDEEGRPDPLLERRLLLSFFERDHAFRTGALHIPRRPACLAHGLGSAYDALLAVDADWDRDDLARDLLDLRDAPSVGDALTWLAVPALLRTLRVHSDPLGCALADGRLGASVLRGAWREGRLRASASFFVHTGCRAISPPGHGRLSFDDPAYGRDNGAEALLFFAGGLALVGRAKVFYDSPRGFLETLAGGGLVGDAWRGGFEIESKAASWSAVGGDIGRKRTYFWSLLGDWTLRWARRR